MYAQMLVNIDLIHQKSLPQRAQSLKTTLPILMCARVVELADTLDLGSSAARRAGSTPVSGTKFSEEKSNT